jgi:hypothetical protein
MEVPDLKKMTLKQLKAISTESLTRRGLLGQLHCVRGLKNFIEKAVAEQMTKMLGILERCVIGQFEDELYENALRNFILAQEKAVGYENLLVQLVGKEIRKAEVDLKGNVYEICQFYIRLMTNLHGLFGWHRANECSEKWREFSRNDNGVSIEINAHNVTREVTTRMDESFKDVIIEKLYQGTGRTSENL